MIGLNVFVWELHGNLNLNSIISSIPRKTVSFVLITSFLVWMEASRIDGFMQAILHAVATSGNFLHLLMLEQQKHVSNSVWISLTTMSYLAGGNLFRSSSRSVKLFFTRLCTVKSNLFYHVLISMTVMKFYSFSVTLHELLITCLPEQSFTPKIWTLSPTFVMSVMYSWKMLQSVLIIEDYMSDEYALLLLGFLFLM